MNAIRAFGQFRASEGFLRRALVLLAIGAAVTCASCTTFKENYYVGIFDPQAEKGHAQTQFYRYRLRGDAGLTNLRFESGLYDARIIDQLFGEVTPPKAAKEGAPPAPQADVPSIAVTGKLEKPGAAGSNAFTATRATVTWRFNSPTWDGRAVPDTKLLLQHAKVVATSVAASQPAGASDVDNVSVRCWGSTTVTIANPPSPLGNQNIEVVTRPGGSISLIASEKQPFALHEHNGELRIATTDAQFVNGQWTGTNSIASCKSAYEDFTWEGGKFDVYSTQVSSPAPDLLVHDGSATFTDVRKITAGQGGSAELTDATLTSMEGGRATVDLPGDMNKPLCSLKNPSNVKVQTPTGVIGLKEWVAKNAKSWTKDNGKMSTTIMVDDLPLEYLPGDGAANSPSGNPAAPPPAPSAPAATAATPAPGAAGAASRVTPASPAAAGAAGAAGAEPILDFENGDAPLPALPYVKADVDKVSADTGTFTLTTAAGIQEAEREGKTVVVDTSSDPNRRIFVKFGPEGVAATQKENQRLVVFMDDDPRAITQRIRALENSERTKDIVAAAISAPRNDAQRTRIQGAQSDLATAKQAAAKFLDQLKADTTSDLATLKIKLNQFLDGVGVDD